MKDQLHRSFVSYLEYAEPFLKYPETREKRADERIHIACVNRPAWLRSVLEHIEGSKEFNKLVSDFSVSLGDKPLTELETASRSWVPIQCSSMRNFLRRSKIYLKIAEGKPVDLDEHFEWLWSISHERQVKTTSLRLLDGVYFPESSIDFETFKIQRFSKRELDELSNNQMNHVFYPYAELETSKLCNYWFIREEEVERRQGANFGNLRLNLSGTIRVSSTFPDRIIQLLALFDWGLPWEPASRETEKVRGWLAPSTPISLRISDDVMESPFPSPYLSGLVLCPDYDLIEYGEEIGIPVGQTIPFNLSNRELEKLKQTVRKCERFLESVDLKQCGWDFYEIAMGFLGKAFKTEGLEQLLWHMVVLESLLGDRTEAQESIRRRLSYILGKTKHERTEIGKSITELYGFRSNLVHGKKYRKQVYKGHLKEARDFARKALLWFLDYLSTIHRELEQGRIPFEDYPQRKEILSLLDFDKNALDRMRFVIGKLPAEFPHIGGES